MNIVISLSTELFKFHDNILIKSHKNEQIICTTMFPMMRRNDAVQYMNQVHKCTWNYVNDEKKDDMAYLNICYVMLYQKSYN